MSRTPHTFASQVMAARAARGLSREQVARHCGVAASVVRAWEMRGEPPPGDADVLRKLADLLRLPVAGVVTSAIAGRTFVRLPCDEDAMRALAESLVLYLAQAGDVDALAAHIVEVTP